MTHRDRKRDFLTLSNSDSHGLLVGRHGFSVKTWVFKGELLVIRHGLLVGRHGFSVKTWVFKGELLVIRLGLLVGRHGFSMKSEVFRHLSRIIGRPS